MIRDRHAVIPRELCARIAAYSLERYMLFGASIVFSANGKRLYRASIALAAALAFSASAVAQSTWTGDFFGVWNQSLNWSPNGIPNSPTAAVNFTGNAVGAINISSSVQTQPLSFSNPTGAYTLTSSAGVSMTGLTAINVGSGVTGTQTIDLANIAGGSLLLTGANHLQITNNSTAAGTTLVIGPNTVIGSLGTGGLIVTGAGSTQISGTFATTAGRKVIGGLTKSGSGTLTLAYSGVGPNPYGGDTLVSEGTLALNSGTIQTGTNITVSGGQFTLGTFAGNTSGTAIGALSLSGSGAFRVPSGSPQYHFNQLLMTGGSLDLAGSTKAVLQVRGAATPIAVNASSTTATWIGGGTSRILNATANPLPISVAAGSTQSGIDLDAGIALSSAGTNPTFTKTGTGTMRLTSLINTANITTSDGVLRVDDLATNGVGALGTGTITLGGGVLAYGGPSATTTKNLTLGALNSTIQLLTPGANLTYNGLMSESVGNAELTVLGPGAGPAASTLTLAGNNAYSGTTRVGGNAIVAIPSVSNAGLVSPIGTGSGFPSAPIELGSSGARGTLRLTGANPNYSTDRAVALIGSYGNQAGGAIDVQNVGTNLTLTGSVASIGSLIKTGAGTLTLTSTNNSYTGGTYVEAGTLSVGTTGAVIPANSDVSVSNGATFQVGFTVGGNTAAPIGKVTLDGSTLRITPGAAQYHVNQLVTTAAGGTLENAGGTLGLAGAGAGATINGNSSWTGAGSVYAVYPNDANLAIAPNVTLTNSLYMTNSFRITGGGTLYQKSQFNAFYSAYFTVAQGRLRVDDLSVDGSGASVLGRVTNPLPVLTLDGGTLQYGGMTQSTAFPIFLGPSGGTIEVSSDPFADTTKLTLSGNITGLGALNKTGPGVLALASNSNQYYGGIAVSGGALEVGSDAQLGLAAITVNPFGTLRYTASTTATARTFTLNNGTLEAPAGVTLTLNDSFVGGGFLRGAGTYALTGDTRLSGASTLTSTTINQTGSAFVANFTNGGSYTLAAGQPLGWYGGTNTSGGRFVVNGTAYVTDFVSNGMVSINPGGVVHNSGAPLVLGGGSRTQIGSAAAPGGTLNLAGQTLELNGAILVNNGTINGTTNVNYGSLATGAGSYGVLNVSQGGIFSPGNSPGVVAVDALHFANTSTVGGPILAIELAGTELGSGYDHVNVTSALSLGGTLAVSLVNFMPSAGQSFDILDWGSLSGTFDTLQLPTLAGLVWNTSQLYTSGVLSLAAAGLAGDYNQDGTVNAADYTVWRNNLGSSAALANDDTPGVGQDDYTRWKINFGNHSGSGSAGVSPSYAAVPEPATLSTLLAGVLAMYSRQRRQ